MPYTRGKPYFVFGPGACELDKDGNIKNPCHPNAMGPEGIIHYRNNVNGFGNVPDKDANLQPSIYHKESFDIWCAGSAYDPAVPKSGWSFSTWITASGIRFR